MSARRSARIQSNLDATLSTTSIIGRKRTALSSNTAPRNAKKRRTEISLSCFTDIPVILIPEILKFLDPIDLLHLSRTSKPLRSLLLNRSSRYIWWRSFDNVSNLPRCPGGVSEPRFVEYLYGKGCISCSRLRLKADETHEIHEICDRLCDKCLAAHFITITDTTEEPFISKPYLHQIYTCLPNYTHRVTKTYHILRRQVERWDTEYQALQTDEEKAAWVNDIVAYDVYRKQIREEISKWKHDIYI